MEISSTLYLRIIYPIGRLTQLLLFLSIAGFLYPNHSPADTVNRVVAIVNDDVITLFELNKKIKEVTGQAPEDLRYKDENRYLQARRMVLELLINDRITREKIEEQGIKVNPKEIDSAIERIKEENQWTHEDLLTILDREGMSFEQYREKIKKELERFRLINIEVKSKIIIREEQINEYYEGHKADFETKGEFHLAGIFLFLKDAENERELQALYKRGEEILRRLKNGEDFGKLAREFSQGPGEQEGGDLGRFDPSQLEPEITKVIESLPEGGVSNLIVRPNGIQILKLIKKQAGRIKPFEDARNAIYSTLYKKEVDRIYSSWINELRESSYTKIIF